MSAFGSDSWGSVGSPLAWVKTEMPFSFSISGTSDEEDVLTGWGDLGQLIKSQALTFGGGDSVSSFVGELEGTDSESFRDVEESGVVSDGTDNCEDSGVELGLSFSDGGVIFA